MDGADVDGRHLLEIDHTTYLIPIYDGIFGTGWSSESSVAMASTLAHDHFRESV